jgi:hypothetical protein
MSDDDNDKTYKVVRNYFKPSEDKRVLFTGKSLEWVQDYCSDPETSSQTCKQAHNQRHTLMHGAWFDGYTEE